MKIIDIPLSSSKLLLFTFLLKGRVTCFINWPGVPAISVQLSILIQFCCQLIIYVEFKIGRKFVVLWLWLLVNIMYFGKGLD